MSLHHMNTGAVRSNDLKGQRWDLISGVFLDRVQQFMDADPTYVPIRLRQSSHKLLHECRSITYDFLAGSRDDIPLIKASLSLMVAIEKEFGDSEQYAAAINKNGSIFSYTALQSLAETLDEGAEKYGSHNWLLGMLISSVLLNHGIHHIFKYQIGDRSENHLGHSLWGYMTSIHMFKTRPDMRIELMEEKYKLTPAMVAKNAEIRLKRHGDSQGENADNGRDSFLCTNASES